ELSVHRDNTSHVNAINPTVARIDGKRSLDVLGTRRSESIGDLGVALDLVEFHSSVAIPDIYTAIDATSFDIAELIHNLRRARDVFDDDPVVSVSDLNPPGYVLQRDFPKGVRQILIPCEARDLNA